MITKSDLVNPSVIMGRGAIPDLIVGADKTTGMTVLIQGEHVITIPKEGTRDRRWHDAMATSDHDGDHLIQGLVLEKRLLLELTKAALVFAERSYTNPAEAGKAAVIAARAALEEINR